MQAGNYLFPSMCVKAVPIFLEEVIKLKYILHKKLYMFKPLF